MKEVILFIQLDDGDLIEGYCLTYNWDSPLIINYNEWSNISSVSSRSKEVKLPVILT